APSVSRVGSSGTSALAEPGQGWTYRNAGLPSADCPTFRQRPPLSFGTLAWTTCPSTVITASYTPEPGSLAVNVTSLTPCTPDPLASSPPTLLTLGPEPCSSVMSDAYTYTTAA